MNKILFIKHGKNLDEKIGGLHAYLAETNQTSINFPFTVNCKGKEYSYSKEEIEIAIFLNAEKNKIIVWRNDAEFNDGFNEIDLTNDNADIFINVLNLIGYKFSFLTQL